MNLKPNLTINTHSSIRIQSEAGLVMYFDPYGITKETKDADVILVTHSHYDHLSPEDIAKVVKKETILVIPESILSDCVGLGIGDDRILTMKPYESRDVLGFKVEAIPSYNVGKTFHPKKNEWIGYVVEVDGKRVYVMGDTDINEDVKKVRCDVLLVPCGGTYTMDYKEAAELTDILRPELAIPTHYGTVVGRKDCGLKFKKAVKGGSEVEILM